MTKAGQTHPAKKKHSPRPRQEIVRLTGEQQVAKAMAEMKKARAILAEAEAVVAVKVAPMASVHSAYYAMHHCAIAVLLVTGGVDRFGDVPGSHHHVVEHFATRVAEVAPGMIGLVDDLRAALLDRMSADYDTTDEISPKTAKDLTARASSFLATCLERWPQLKQ